jgi:hypothetical protein
MNTDSYNYAMGAEGYAAIPSERMAVHPTTRGAQAVTYQRKLNRTGRREMPFGSSEIAGAAPGGAQRRLKNWTDVFPCRRGVSGRRAA